MVGLLLVTWPCGPTAVGSGLCFGAAALRKPTLGLGVLVVSLWIASTHPGPSRALLPFVSALLLIAAVAGALVLAGAGPDLASTYLRYAPAYASVGDTSLAALLLTQLLGVAVQARFFTYHHAASMPIVALLAAPGYHARVERLSARLPHLSWLAGPAVAAGVLWAPVADPRMDTAYLTLSGGRLAALAAASVSPWDARATLDRALGSDLAVNERASRAIAEWIQEHTPPGAPTFVWGFDPEIYLVAARPPASRFLHNLPHRSAWAGVRPRQLLLTDLERHPPAAVVVGTRDSIPEVTGDSRTSLEVLADFPALADWLSDHHAAAAHLHLGDIYLRRAGPAAA